MTHLSRALVAPVRVYQRLVSPLFGPRCRFSPSCSEYSVRAILRYGPLKGLYLGIRRVLRCHPWSDGGIDEIPATFSWRSPSPDTMRRQAPRSTGTAA